MEGFVGESPWCDALGGVDECSLVRDMLINITKCVSVVTAPSSCLLGIFTLSST